MKRIVQQAFFLTLGIAAAASLTACQATGASSPAAGAPPGADPAAAAVRIAKAVGPALVRVEYTLRYDKGEPPRAAAGIDGAPAELIEEERPLEEEGYLLSPTRVVTANLMIHPRFIEKINVRCGDKTVAAKPTAYGALDQGIFLELTEPLTEARPLTFNSAAPGPYYTVNYLFEDGNWTTVVNNLSGPVVVAEDGRQFQVLTRTCLITDKAGVPVAVGMRFRLPLDGSWKVAPDQWETISAQKMAQLLEEQDKRAQAGLLRVTLSFRSPQKQGGREEFDPGEGGDQGTDRHVAGVLVDDRTVLVLANLRAKQTARLEKIRVYGADGQPAAAAFAGTLTDYGALVVKLDKPMTGAVTVRPGAITDVRDDLLLCVELMFHGEQRVTYHLPARIQGFEKGRRSELFPNVTPSPYSTFLFDRQGRLVTLPVALRAKAGGDQEDRWRERRPLDVPASRLLPVLADLAKNTDKYNVPLSEEEENRVAWLGVEVQPMDAELARANQVSDQTQDGQTGAIINYIYPDSPAAKAGLALGDILLRLSTADRPKPIEIRMTDRGFGFGDEPFPWDKLDMAPEQVYDRIPIPWPGADNSLNRTITDLGFGKKFTLEFVRGGKVQSKDLEVVQSPPYYNTAPKFKSEPLGVTVRQLTFEALRYFQRKPEEGGLIVSKIEPGSKVSVAGLKPYEIITHVNDKPMMTVKDFEAAVKGGGELRLSVMRMTKGRLVKVTIPASAATRPAGVGSAGDTSSGATP